MADFTADEMRKIATLMENAIQGDDNSAEKQEQRDVCRMIYNVAKKSNDPKMFSDVLWYMTNGELRNLDLLINERWVNQHGSCFDEEYMVDTFKEAIEEDMMLHNGGDYDEADGYDEDDYQMSYPPTSSNSRTFKELIDDIYKYEDIDIVGVIPYIKMIDTLPLL